jgi:serine/threonine-protein kinase
MLIEEAKLSALLHHPNIVQTFDLGRIDDSYFIVMEHVEGYDLAELLRTLRERGDRVPVGVAAHVVAELCRGLAHAHHRVDDQGRPLHIVHRDVSPQNILLSFAGEVKIADFGIAKTAARVSDPELGVIRGKWFYMSPEQAWGDPLDYRTDIFSAGIVLWELLVGDSLYQAKHVQALLDDVRRAEIPPPSSVRPEVTAELDAIVARATAVDPNDRFHNAEAFGDALCEVLATRPWAHPEAWIRAALSELELVQPSIPRAAKVPKTRDRVVIRPTEDRSTPPEAPIRFDLDDGEPTVAGWKSPAAHRRRQWLGWLLGACSLLAALALGWLAAR